MSPKQLIITALLTIVFHAPTLAETPIGRFVDMKPVVPIDQGEYDDRHNPITADGLQMFFGSNNRPGGVNGFDVLQVSRSSVDEPFGPPTYVTELNTVNDDLPTGLSPDGLTLYLESSRFGAGTISIFSASRPSLSEPFGPVTNVGDGVNSTVPDRSATVSGDDLTLYFSTVREGDYDLWQATRSSPDEEFTGATKLENVNSDDRDDGPSVSSDGLHLFFESRPDGLPELRVASRSHTDEPFGAPVNLNDFSLGSEINGDDFFPLLPYISPDWPAEGSKLYFTRFVSAEKRDVYEATWVPEPSTAVLSCLGFMSLLAWRRKKRVTNQKVRFPRTS